MGNLPAKSLKFAFLVRSYCLRNEVPCGFLYVCVL